MDALRAYFSKQTWTPARSVAGPSPESLDAARLCPV